MGLRGQEASTIRKHEWLRLSFGHSFSSLTDCPHVEAGDNSKIPEGSLKEYKHKKMDYCNLENI